jgi:hypothetical protein
VIDGEIDVRPNHLFLKSGAYKLCAAVRKIPKAYTKKLEISCIMQNTFKMTEHYHSKNAYIVFGEGPHTGAMAWVGLVIQEKQCNIWGNYVVNTTSDIKFNSGNKAFNVKVTADMKSKDLCMVVDHTDTLRSKLTGEMMKITHAGVGCYNTEAYFSNISIEGE